MLLDDMLTIAGCTSANTRADIEKRYFIDSSHEMLDLSTGNSQV